VLAVDPHRSFPGEGEQRWYDGQDHERGRHGGQAPPAGGGAYGGAEEEYTGTGNVAFGDARHGDAYGRGFGDADVPGPRSGDTDPGDTSRRSAESIDVGSLRRAPVSSPPAYPPAYGVPPDQSLFQANPQGSGYGPGANPHGSGYGPGSNPLSAPTAAVNTLPPNAGPGAIPPSAVPQIHQPNASVYHSRKPALMIVLAVLTLLFEIPALRLLTSAAIEDLVSVSGVVAGTFLVAGIPAFAYGVYGLLGGATVNTHPATWLKAPLVYLPMGVLLFLFAALAAA
jgi:hypothetical protein